MKDFIEELKWRGMLHDVIPGTEEHLEKNKTIGYIGFDPTSDSLHIGSLVPIFILKHFQNSGHTPIVLLGGATGMIGDPSGKSDERNLLDKKVLDYNEKKLTKQFEKFLDFKSKKSNKAILVNNYNWMKKFSIIDFSRDIGKHITVNYMMAKESVKKRISKDTTQGMSFTEFTYQLIQGYDFLHLYKEMNCMLQMGGSDQWGNITTGTELIRRKENKKVFAMTCPLIKKSDGSKFGKSEGGNIWLDKEKTSVYKFYQYWLNISDEDAVNYIKVFTFLDKQEVEDLIDEHKKDKSKRLLQNKIAGSITSMVHSEDDLKNAVKASKVLFGKSSKEDLESLNENTFNEIFDGVPSSSIGSKELAKGINIDFLLAKDTNFLKSMGEARRSIKENSISVNKIKVFENTVVSNKDLIDEHQKDKSKRLLQNKIADSITSMVHSEDDLKNAIKASKVLFGKSSKEDLESLDENTFNEIFDGVPSSSIGSKQLAKGISIDFLLAKDTNFLKSMGEARRSLKENSISVNKIKVSENTVVSNKDLINNKYLLLQRGRKNYYLVIVK